MKPQVHLKCVVGPPTKPNYLVCEVRSKSDTLLKTYARKLPTTFDTLSPDNRDRFIHPRLLVASLTGPDTLLPPKKRKETNPCPHVKHI